MPSSPTSEPTPDTVSASAAAPTYDAVRDAGHRLAGIAVRTPLLESPALNELCGGRVLVKAETLQRTGSFKFRGAYNRISRLDTAEMDRGVVAYSSGNHAQGVAAAASMHGVAATIVMPESAPAIKQHATRRHGAEVILHDGTRPELEAFAHDLTARTGAVLIRPFDDNHVIAGQGTVGLELAEQAKEMGAALDAVVIPCGGGGLSAGMALVLERDMPDCALFISEPAGFDDTRRSLALGERVANAPGARSICDALLVPICGELTFPINLRLLSGGFAVDDGEVERAMVALFTHVKLVMEPGGAVALAACLSGAHDCGGKTVAVVASGGNVDPGLFAEILSRNPMP
jgi:threonine dehydratase